MQLSIESCSSTEATPRWRGTRRIRASHSLTEAGRRVRAAGRQHAIKESCPLIEAAPLAWMASTTLSSSSTIAPQPDQTALTTELVATLDTQGPLVRPAPRCLGVLTAVTAPVPYPQGGHEANKATSDLCTAAFGHAIRNRPSAGPDSADYRAGRHLQRLERRGHTGSFGMASTTLAYSPR